MKSFINKVRKDIVYPINSPSETITSNPWEEAYCIYTVWLTYIPQQFSAFGPPICYNVWDWIVQSDDKFPVAQDPSPHLTNLFLLSLSFFKAQAHLLSMQISFIIDCTQFTKLSTFCLAQFVVLLLLVESRW